MNKISHWHEVWETLFPICTIERRIKLEFLSKEKFTFLFHWPLFAICYPPAMNTNLTYGFSIIFHRLRTNSYCMESIIWLTIRGFYKNFFLLATKIFLTKISHAGLGDYHALFFFSTWVLLFLLSILARTIFIRLF